MTVKTVESQKTETLTKRLNLENYETLVAGSVTSRFVDEVLPTVSDEASGKHQCQDLSCVV